ncbi:MAG: DUF3800 domain-containing protein [Candidatus Magasanikbacteria bacterium]|nr:DUF3800 domain-containing protein [Candidatus Magasanikbacteria bacterium]
MLVFIDDSGDPGFKLDRGSSRYFIISLIIFRDPLEAEKAAVAIKELRRRLGFPDTVEFKFAKSRKTVREQFLRTILPFSFAVRSLVIDKSIIRSEELRTNKRSFYSYAIKLVLQYSDGKILDAKIKVDGSGDRVFRRSFVSYLRSQLNSDERRIVQHCKLVDSRENVLIQMADMIAGSIHRSYEDFKTDAVVYKKIIKNHIQDEWKFK